MANKKTLKNKKQFNLLFVQDSPCIRNYKMATALRAKGHSVSLAYTIKRLSERYSGLSDDVYNDNIHLQSSRHLWDISKQYDIVHCHNEPDILTVAALAGDAPVIHDTHDLISLRGTGDANIPYFEGIANRGAASRVYSTPYQLEEAKKLYGVEGPSLVFYNYASAVDLPQKYLPKLSANDGQVHIVYEGGVGGIGHREFTDLFVQLANHNIHIHIYPASYNQEQDNFFSQYDCIHYNSPVSPKKIMEEMTRYDFGIIPFNIELGNKRFLDSTIANKLFEYLAAGLPVVASPLQSYTDYFKNSPVGITFNSFHDIINNIDKLKNLSKNVDFSKHIYTFESEIHMLEEFYANLLNEYKDRKVQVQNNFEIPKDPIQQSTDNLLTWLDKNGWDGYDPYDVQDYFIQKEKSGSPISEKEQSEIKIRADLNPVLIREELGINKKRNAKALGLLTTAYCKLYEVSDEAQYLNKAKKMADWLLKNPSKGFKNLCWGYPFDWQSVIFIPKGTPSAVVTTTVGYGMWELFKITGDKKYFAACESICHFITKNLNMVDMGINGVCFSYTPIDNYQIHNSNLFCGEFLARVGKEVGNNDWCELAKRTADYALAEQNEDGSIYYWGKIQNHNSPNHLDHYHSGFEIRCLFSIAKHLQQEDIKFGYLRYLKFYLKNYFLPDGTPKINPGNAYPVNIHSAAEAVLMLSALADENPKFLEIAQKTLEWTINNMQTSEGWFGHLWSPQSRIDAPYLRWGQAWMLRAIAEYKVQQKKQSNKNDSSELSICHIGAAHSTVLRDLVKELDDLGYRQCVLTYLNDRKNLIQDNVNVYYFPYNMYASPEWKQNKMEENLEKILGEILKKEKVNLVHGHKLEACCVPAWMAKEVYDLPTVLSPHNLLFLDYKNDSPVYFYTERCLKSVDRIAQGQTYMLDRLQEVYNLDKERLFTGGGYPVYFKDCSQIASSNGSQTILCARQMGGEQYAQHLIVEALPSVIAEFPNVKLIMLIGHSVEQGQETFDKLNLMVKEKQLEKNVEFVPYALSLPDLNDLMGHSDIVMSLNYLDPGLAGTSLAAAYSGAITFVSESDFPVDIEDGINGFRVKHESGDIAKKLIYALQNKEKLRKKFSTKNKIKLKKYSAEEIVKQVNSLYDSVLKSKN